MEQNSSVVNCPDEVADVVLTLLREAILNMRMAANADSAEVGAEYCAIEATHIHNLPVLLRHYSRKRLEGYLKHGRGDYIREVKMLLGKEPETFKPL